MHRFFGKKKEEVPGPTISETMGRLEGRSGDLDGKIAKLDEELRRYNAQVGLCFLRIFSEKTT